MDPDLETITAKIREVGKVGAVGPDDDFYAAGFSSINALELLLGLEDSFGVSIPDDQFVEARTPRALLDMIAALKTT
ncbi:MAG: acyl carrier protein [Gemmataceae bacterium]|nr:acyl carrier protein [Gemmataceae bacterium]